MHFRDKVRILNYVLKAHFQKIRYPLAIRWNVTNRCPLRCLYCDIHDNSDQTYKTQELCTKDILIIIKEIAEFGIVRMSFSGGEPMVREDIGEIITYCKSIGIGAELNSSGKFISTRSDEIRDIALLKLSLDGPKEIHERVRFGSKFEEIIEVADICAKKNMKFSFCTTISKYNVSHLKAVLDIARFYNTIVAFQPVKYLSGSSKGIKNCYPLQEQFKLAIKMLMREKKTGNKHIRNSMPGLKYIYNWPEYNKVRCQAGKVFCMIGPDGTVYPCDRIAYTTTLPTCREAGFKQAFEKIPLIQKCAGCGYCGTTELNFLMSFNYNGIAPIREYV